MPVLFSFYMKIPTIVIHCFLIVYCQNTRRDRVVSHSDTHGSPKRRGQDDGEEERNERAPRHEDHHEWPDQVELFFDREGPEMVDESGPLPEGCK